MICEEMKGFIDLLCKESVNDIFLMLIDMDLSLELFLCPAIVELMLWIFLKDAYICVKIYTPYIKMCEYVCIYWCKYLMECIF